MDKFALSLLLVATTTSACDIGPRFGLRFELGSGGSGSRASWQTIPVEFPTDLTVTYRAVEIVPVHDGDEERPVSIRDGGATLVEGPCRETAAVECSPAKCVAPMERTDYGNCVVRLRLTTANGHHLSTCFYNAMFWGTEAKEQQQEDVERAIRDCRDG